MEGAQPALDSIRAEEKMYESEIRTTYKDYPHLFITHSSDNLYLDIVRKNFENLSYQALISKTSFKAYDIISEVRGSVIGQDKLRALLNEKIIEKTKLPLLLYLNAELRFLLSPKNITKYLFTHPQYERQREQYEGDWSKRGNCRIQNHFGFKLFVTASRDIEVGQQLILEQKSYDNLVFDADDSGN